MDYIEKLRQHPIVATAVALTAAYSVVAAIYICLVSEYKDLQNARITEYQDRLSELKRFEENYHEESKKRKEIELRNVQISNDIDSLSTDYRKLKEASWEEKYLTEQISRHALEEELILTKKRYEVEVEGLKSTRDELVAQNAQLSSHLNKVPELEKTKMSDTLVAFDNLLEDKEKTIMQLHALKKDVEEKNARIAELQDELLVVKNKNLKLRQLIERGNILSENPSSPQSVKILATSLKKISDDFYCLNAFLRGVPLIQGGLTGSEFAYVLKSANISDDFYCSRAVVQCAKYIKPPLTEKDVDSILGSIGDNFYNATATNAIMTRMAKLETKTDK